MVKILSYKLISALENALHKISKRWYAEAACVPSILERENPYDDSVELSHRGINVIDPFDTLKGYPQPRVVIIGAGMAGLSAAARLNQQGISDVTVLEAYARPGGRIHSCWIGDVVAELGAHWWENNYQANPLLKMLASEDPPRPALRGVYHPRGLFSNVVAEKMEFPPTFNAYSKFREIEKEAYSIYVRGGHKQQGSMINFISSRIERELRSFPEEFQHDAARVMFGLAHLYSSCGQGVGVGLMCYDDFGYYMQMVGGKTRVPLGLIAILAPLLYQIPMGSIRYCTPAHCIYWGTTEKTGHRAVVVGGDGERFPADYVIVTISLGALSKSGSRLFCPALPATKSDAMRELGFGVCNKVYLEYSRPLWIWQQEDLCYRFRNKELASRSDWTRGITAIEIVPNSRTVLCVWVAGLEAIEMEGVSDKDVAEGVTEVLRLITGQMCVPYPNSLIRSQWYTDMFFKGSYSFEPNDSDGELQKLLACPLPCPAQPVPPILLFAGEATAPGHYATVSGARLSGIREADRIVELTLQFKGPPALDSTTKQKTECLPRSDEKEK